MVKRSGPITTPGNYPCPGSNNLKVGKASPVNKMKVLLIVKKIELIKVIKQGKTWIWIAWIASLVALVGILGYHLLNMNGKTQIIVLLFEILSASHKQIY